MEKKNFTKSLVNMLAYYVTEINPVSPTVIAASAGVSVPTVYKFINEEAYNEKIVNYIFNLYNLEDHYKLKRQMCAMINVLYSEGELYDKQYL